MNKRISPLKEISGKYRKLTFGSQLRRLFLVCVGSLALSGVPSESTAFERVYSVEGEVRCRSELDRTADSVAFTVCVSNCVWSITTESSRERGTIFKEFYDGDVVTSATHFPEGAEKLSSMGNDSVLGIEHKDTPNCLPPAIGPVWLAYASACKLAGKDEGALELSWAIDQKFVRCRFKAPASWILAPEAPFLPSQVEYFFETNSFYNALSESQPVDSEAYKNIAKLPPWASFRVLSLTNVEGLSLPKTFELIIYAVESQKRVLTSYRGDVKNVTATIAANAFEHGFGKKTFVQDERFISKDTPAAFIRYVTTNTVIPKTNDPQMVKAFTRAKLSQFLQKGPREAGRSHLLTFLVFSTLALIPFVVLLTQKGRRK